MTITRIPRTNVRPNYLIKVYSTNINKPIPLLRASQNFLSDVQSYMSDMKDPIGYVQSISLSTTRTNKVYRELNFSSLGKIKEVYPGLAKYSAKVSKIAIFSEHLLDAFKATSKDYFSGTTGDGLVSGFNIYNQIAPLILKLDLLEPVEHPETKEWTAEDKTTSIILWDCWFKSSAIDFAISEEADLALTQESDIEFAWLIAY